MAQAQEVNRPVPKGQPVPESGQQAGKGGATKQGEKKKPSPEKLSPSLDKIESAIRDLIAQQRAAQSKGPEHHEIRDLKAQEGMALWAQTMFWTTLAAVVLTFAGIILIWRTLSHTRRAANYARDMVAEAQKTTNAAIRANDAAYQSASAARASVEVAQKSAEHQLRAYVTVSEAKVVWGSGRISKAEIVIGNTGQTPALNVTHWVANGAGGNGQFKIPQPPATTEMSRTSLGAGGSLTLDTKFDWLTDKDRDRAQARQMPLYVWGKIQYNDVFRRETRHTTFSLILNQGSDDLVPRSENNECT